LNTSGCNNIFAGLCAGSTNTTGCNNIIFGANAQATSATTSNETTIGTSSTTSARIFGDLKFLNSYSEVVYTISDGASVDLNPTNGTIQLWALGATRTPTANNFSAGQSMTLMINDGSAYTINWPSVTWVGGSAPTLATTGNTVIELWKVGGNIYGALVGEVA
jgi:hypothetical protein